MLKLLAFHPISTSFRLVIATTVHPNQVELLHHVHFPGQSPFLYHSNTVGTIHTEHSNETHEDSWAEPVECISEMLRCCGAVRGGGGGVGTAFGVGGAGGDGGEYGLASCPFTCSLGRFDSETVVVESSQSAISITRATESLEFTV